MRQFLTIDTGGTKTRIVQFADVSSVDEAYSAPILHEVEIPTPHHKDEYIAKVADAIKQNFSEFCKSPEENAVILATRGSIDDGRVTTHRLGWNSFPVADALQEHIPNTQIIVENDAKIGTLGAFSTNFKGRGIYVTIGSGIGVGMMIDGKLSHELSNMEAGHMYLRQTNGEFIEWEKVASGVAFSEKYKVFGDEISIDNPIWREYADDLSLGLYVLLPTLRPDKIVFGGAISEFFYKFGDAVEENLHRVAPGSAYFNVETAVVSDPRYVTNRGALIFGLKYAERR